MEYVCQVCGKTFSRKKPFQDGTILCNGCLISRRKKESFNDPEKKKAFLDKQKSTNIEKYGVENISHKKEFLEKSINTRKEKYGIIGAFQSTDPDLQKKISENSHNKESFKKRADTSLNKYGVPHFMKSSLGKSKVINTIKEKYGVDNIMKSSELDSKKIFKSYFYEDNYFDSSWELAYYIWLRDSGTPFTYQPQDCLIEYFDNKGTQHIYRPDFKVNNSLVEIKGDHFFNEKNEPYNSYTKTFWWEKYNILIENKVIILRLADVKVYLKYVYDTYGKDFLKEHKVRHINKNRM